jgi:hypothetical protein
LNEPVGCSDSSLRKTSRPAISDSHSERRIGLRGSLVLIRARAWRTSITEGAEGTENDKHGETEETKIL